MFNNKGFTLLEVLLVVSILAIVSGFSAASYRNYNRNVEMNSAGKNIIYDLRQIRSRAAAGEERRRWGAHFVNGTLDYYELFSSPTDYNDVAKVIINTVYLPAGVKFNTPAEGMNQDIIFNSILGTTANNSLTISSEENIKTINITVSGTVY